MKRTVSTYISMLNKSAMQRLCTIGLLGLLNTPLMSLAAPLPPPPRLGDPFFMSDAVVFLELVVNQHTTGRVVRVQMRNGHHLVDADDLRRVAVTLPGSPQGMVELEAVPGMRVSYDGARARLLLDVPVTWLPQQDLLSGYQEARVPSRSSFGVLANYQAYTLSPQQGNSYTSVWNELRAFGRYGFLRTTGVYQHPYSSKSDLARRYLRYDTSWQYSDEDRVLTYEAGDLISRSMGWSTSVRMAGVQISRDFSLRPDIVTYPLPQFSGQAAVPTSVDLFVDGYKNSSQNVNPGPFTITNVPFINGAGEAVVVTTDALGREVTTTTPFYVTSSLLQPGLTDFSFAAGSLRKDYGLRNFSYGSGVISGSGRYGLTDYFTLEGHAEVASSLKLGGIGGVMRLGNFGVVNAAYSRSQSRDQNGYQAALGYQYSRRNFNIGARHTRRSDGYRDLSNYKDNFRASQRSTTANMSLSMNQYGNLGVGYFDIRAYDASRMRLMNLSWSRSVGDASFIASSNREIGGNGWAFALQLMIPLGGSHSASVGFDQDANHARTARVNYRKSPASDGGFGWGLGYSDGNRTNKYQQADLSWRGDHLQLQGGIYGESGRYNRWAEASGSVVMMDSSVHFANQVGDAFVLLSTDKQADIPVRYENRLVGQTNKNGHLLVPGVISNYNAKYEIDALNLPSNVDAPEVEKRVSVKRGSGYLLHFPVAPIASATVALVDDKGKPLPVGSKAYGDAGQIGYVGWDGLLFMDHLQSHNQVRVELVSGGQCSTSFEVNTQASEIVQLGSRVCR